MNDCDTFDDDCGGLTVELPPMRVLPAVVLVAALLVLVVLAVRWLLPRKAPHGS